jgi:predicted nuclease with TOPRIM domain
MKGKDYIEVIKKEEIEKKEKRLKEKMKCALDNLVSAKNRLEEAEKDYDKTCEMTIDDLEDETVLVSGFGQSVFISS